jgi:hypothetical protein
VTEYVIRIGSPLQHHYHTGQHFDGMPLWSRDLAAAHRYTDHDAANAAAQQMVRWRDCPHRDIVQVNA